MTPRTSPLLVVLAALLLAGCETSNRFVVNAMNQPEIMGQNKTYVLAASEDAPQEETLIFKEAARYLDTALQAEGYRRADTADSADLIIEVDFGVSEPQTRIYETREPVYAHIPERYVRRVVKVRSKNGSETTKVVYAYRPSRRTLVGWQDNIKTETVFDKHMILRAYASRPQDDGSSRSEEIWNVEVSNQNRNGDLRYFLPRMIATAMTYFDANTGQLKQVRLKDDDPQLMLVLNEVPEV